MISLSNYYFTTFLVKRDLIRSRDLENNFKSNSNFQKIIKNQPKSHPFVANQNWASLLSAWYFHEQTQQTAPHLIA